LISDAPWDQARPVVCAAGPNAAYIVWEDFRNGSHFDIYAQRIGLDGTIDPVWPIDGLRVCGAQGNQQVPQLVPDGSGGAFVLWSDARSTWQLYCHHLKASGGLDPAWPTNGLAVNWPYAIGVTGAGVSDGAGGLLVVTSDSLLRASHLSQNGVLDESWPDTGVVLARRRLGGAISDGAGGCFVGWGETRYQDQPALYVQHLLASGEIDPEWPVGGFQQYHRSDGYTFTMKPASDGAVLIAWYEDWNDRFAMQRVLPSGQRDDRWPAAGVLISMNVLTYFSPLLVSDGSGGGLLAWRKSLGASADLYGQSVLANGYVDPSLPFSGSPICTAAGEQSDPVMVEAGNGGAYLAWMDRRNGGADIYAQRVNTRLLPLAVPNAEPEGLRGRVSPNPARRDAPISIEFALREPRSVSLTVWDIAGRRVRSFAGAVRPSGSHELRWPGVYLFDLSIGTKRLWLRCVVL
jgi:hypothetical protein